MFDILLVILLIISIIVTIRGFFILIDDHNFLLVMIYFVLVFPIAVIHAFVLGFGKYKDTDTKIQ
jgi:hypothetical protein